MNVLTYSLTPVFFFFFSQRAKKASLIFFFLEKNVVTILFKKCLVTLVEMYRFLLQMKVNRSINY